MICEKCGHGWIGEYPAEGQPLVCPACGHIDVDGKWWNEDWRDGYWEWFDSDAD